LKPSPISLSLSLSLSPLNLLFLFWKVVEWVSVGRLLNYQYFSCSSRNYLSLNLSLIRVVFLFSLSPLSRMRLCLSISHIFISLYGFWDEDFVVYAF
jgi:hypothetical protein